MGSVWSTMCPSSSVFRVILIHDKNGRTYSIPWPDSLNILREHLKRLFPSIEWSTAVPLILRDRKAGETVVSHEAEFKGLVPMIDTIAEHVTVHYVQLYIGEPAAPSLTLRTQARIKKS
jgi:hypothetical protein